MARKRIAVLISGRGSNLGALIEAARDPGFPGEIVLALSDRAEAQGLLRAAEAAIPAAVVDREGFGKGADGRAAFEQEIARRLAEVGADLACLAGFMRILSPDFAARWRGRLLNIHPSLLPAFKGLDVHARMIAAGVKIAGCTVHFVSAEMDAGPIIGQAATPVLPRDDAETLAARILLEEHKLYPACVRLVCQGRARLTEAGTVELDPSAAAGAPLRNPL